MLVVCLWQGVMIAVPKLAELMHMFSKEGRVEGVRQLDKEQYA